MVGALTSRRQAQNGIKLMRVSGCEATRDSRKYHACDQGSGKPEDDGVSVHRMSSMTLELRAGGATLALNLVKGGGVWF